MSTELAQAGGPVAVAGLALLILARPRGLRLLGLAVCVLGAALLVPLLAPDDNAGLLAGAAVAGLALAGGLAALFRRYPWALPLLALAATPARIPVSIGETDATLLLPLYAIVAGGAILLAWQLVRDDARSRELGLLAWPLALLVFWLGLSTAWTNDVREASVQLLFFFVPFGLLAISLSRLPWRERPVGWLYRLLGAMAVLFSAVGIGQWLRKDVFWNPKVMVGNDTEPFFRVNSLFWDPSIYGRFLVVAILATLVVLVLGLAGRRWPWPVAGIVLAWVGLFFSYSQSSFVSLVAGILLLGALAWRGHVLLATALVAVALVAVGATGPLGATGVGSRGTLVSEGIGIAVDHPLVGVGLGGFKEAYAERLDLRQRSPKKAASHTTPVTVAAESGFPGLALLGWLVVAAGLAVARRPREGGTLPRAALWAAGLAAAAIVVHSCFYNAFFEDPLMWGSLGVVALAAAAARRPEGSA